MAWQHFLIASGFNRLLPTRFRNTTKLEHKLNHFMRRALILPAPLQASTIHFPDVLQFSLVWCLLDIPDIDTAIIPPCMYRHLFEHTKQQAVLRYGATSTTTHVEAYTFKDEFTHFMVENDIPSGTHMLLRHTGNFMFDI
ncbi:unnamed protein product, partial [Cuscuta europaea]